MKCPNCGAQSNRVIIRSSGSYCHACGGIAETAGSKLSGILTRQSARVQRDQAKHGADTVIPHKHDSATGKTVVNPDFVKLYPEHTSIYYKEEDVKRSGDKKLTKLWQNQNEQKQTHNAAIEQMANPTSQKGDTRKKSSFVKGL